MKIYNIKPLKKGISKILVVFILLYSTSLLFGCDNIADNEHFETDPIIEQTTALTTALTTELTSEKTNEGTATQTEAISTLQNESKDHIGDFYTIITDATQLLMRIAEFEMNMWETTYKYSDSKQIDETFAFLYEKSGSAETVEGCYSSISKSFIMLTEGDYEIEFKLLLSNCKTSYENLQNTIVFAHGTYGEFCEEYNTALVDMAYDYDELVDYLIKIGYFK